MDPFVPRLARAVGAVLASVLAGLVVAALALPLIGAGGLAAKHEAQSFLDLPADFATPVPEQRSAILAADGSLIAYLYTKDRVAVALDAIPLHVRHALIAIEDARFYEHNGIDLKGSVRAAVENATSGGVVQGGSTITQQYVKNVLIAEAATPEERTAAAEKSLSRKLREARLALALEQRLSKDEILRRYLNLAYFGNGAYGVEAASQTYFGHGVVDLTVTEGALLVGLVQSPSQYDPVVHPEAALARRNDVLRHMADQGYLEAHDLPAALAAPIGLHPTTVVSGCEAAAAQYAFFCDYVRRALETGPLGAPLGATLEERQERLFTGGLTIKTTLDPRMQAIAQATVMSSVPPADPSGVAAALTTVEPGTGLVRALAVNRVFGDGAGQTKLNLALGGTNGMQPGSSFKPFVLAAALEKGIPLDLTLYAPPVYTSRVFKDCDGNSCSKPYVVRNAGDSEGGVMDLVTATHESVNTYYVQLEERTGVELPASIAESLGVHQFVNGAPTAPLLRGGSFTLGANEVSPLDMAGAYAAFAAHGTYCPPRPVVSITDMKGQDVALPPEACKQALPAAVADTVTSVLRGVIDGPWGKTAPNADIGRPAAGKTGTTDGSKAAWFVGYTPQLATSVWIGTPVPTPLRGVRINGRYYPQVYGGSLPAPMWAQAMQQMLAPVALAQMPAAVAPRQSAVDPGSATGAPQPRRRAPTPRRTTAPIAPQPEPAPATDAAEPAAPAPQ